jgi:anion-transporting  ArsA/GET3 family ATPase
VTGSVEEVVAGREVVVTCGAGGVGKTTTAAAIATMAAVHLGGRVLVLTVDPARRLADALGLQALGNVSHRVPVDAFTAAGLAPRGELWVAMLDTKASWDDLVRLQAPDDDTAARILANPLYGNVTGTFVQSHDYIAMERLYELHASGEWDLLVIDTPPTRHAIDFLDAPKRMADFFSSRFLRLLTAPARSRLATAASRPFYQVADRVLGSQFLQDIAEFFLLFQSMYDGFIVRARAVEALLRDRRTTFVVVSTLEAAPVREAEFFCDELVSRGLHLGAVVLNRVLPDWMADPAAGDLAHDLDRDPRRLAEHLVATGRVEADLESLAATLATLADNYLRYQVVARREREEHERMAQRADVVARVPLVAGDIGDLAGLSRLGEALRR